MKVDFKTKKAKISGHWRYGSRFFKNYGFMFRTFIVLLIAIFALQCSRTPHTDSETKSIELIQIDTVLLEQGAQLFGKFYEHMRISQNGSYWLFNERIRNQVFVFNSDGSFHSVIGKRGRGPDEILTVSSFDINKNNEVAIFDGSQRMIKIFTLDGRLISSNNILENADFSLVPHYLWWYKGQLAGTIIDLESRFEPYKSRLLALINDDGSTDTAFGKFDPFSKQDHRETFVSLLALDEENNVAYTNLQSSPYFQIYDMEHFERILYGGKITESFNKPSQEVTPQTSLSKIMLLVEDTSVFAHIFLTDEYFIQHMQILTKEWFETSDYTAKGNVLVFYDRETNEFIKEIKLEGITPLAAQKGKIYAVENFNPDQFTIGIYEISTNTE